MLTKRIDEQRFYSGKKRLYPFLQKKNKADNLTDYRPYHITSYYLKMGLVYSPSAFSFLWVHQRWTLKD
jgi:hypothetical protein